MRFKMCVSVLLLCASLPGAAQFDEVVVTIYFSGTNLDGSMWNDSDSPFDRPETVASLHRAQLADDHHHKGIVDGIVQNLTNDPFTPPWAEQLDKAEDIFDERPACSGECVILNLVGFSRGAVSTLHTAHSFYANEPSLKKINILAFDPVPGDRLRTSAIFVLPPIAEYVGFYANDERSLGFAPVIPSDANTDEAVDLFLVPGAHNTMIGSVYRNGHRDAHGESESRLDPISRALRIVATELLGSSAWGAVRFDPDGNGSVAMDWYEGQDDAAALRDQFVNNTLLPIFDSYYGFMREFSLVAPADIDFREGWSGGDCVNTDTADHSRLSQRCVYTDGFNGTPIGQSDGPLTGVDDLHWVDDFVNGEYRLWRLIEERGRFDTDNDDIDFAVDNCRARFNPDQIDADGDGYGNVCDADFNNDCIVNFLDFSLFSSAFLSTDAVYDTNNDGIVNFLDLTLVVNMFFNPPGPGAGSCGS
ncbi:MAG: hypothetical protein AAF465_08920 [Pseudomonadota bacterium]